MCVHGSQAEMYLWCWPEKHDGPSYREGNEFQGEVNCGAVGYHPHVEYPCFWKLSIADQPDELEDDWSHTGFCSWSLYSPSHHALGSSGQKT